MKSMKTRSVIAFITSIVVLTAFQSVLSGMVVANYSECAFGETCSGSTGLSSGMGEETQSAVAIQWLVVQGAGHFLKADSEILLFLNKIEMSQFNGIDYSDIQPHLTSAISEMEAARDNYLDLKALSDSAPYNHTFVNHLKKFDYDKHQQLKKLSTETIQEVKSYLGEGDVKGFYAAFLKKTEAILERLYYIKQSIDSKTLPVISDIWRLNQMCTETLLFGQDAAEIFYSVR